MTRFWSDFARGLLILGFFWMGARPSSADEDVVEVVVELNRGEDRGQNFGSLFELRDDQGRALIGAGFPGAYNTFDRSDRHVLHVFEANEAETRVEALPRVNGDAGVYLFDRDGRLYARSAADGQDTRVRVYRPETSVWEVTEDEGPEAVRVADGLLVFREQSIEYKGREILAWPASDGKLGRGYFADGWLVVWNTFEPDDPRVERFLAWEWEPGSERTLRREDALVLQLDRKREFPYALGSWGADLLVTTNQGGVYRLRNRTWDAMRRPDGQSHQVYAAMNVGEELWLGQYPSGEIWTYAGDGLVARPGWPPVMPGVSSAAREAQTVTIYGGDVYVGVWPWAELWRHRPGSDGWSLDRRMFTQPEPTDATTHPYERETMARGPVLNQWGQRITGLVPMGTDLYVATSAKSSKPWSPEFDFLNERAREEYGRVYRLSRPGHLSAPLAWTDGPTEIRVVLSDSKIALYQDGELRIEGPRASKEFRPGEAEAAGSSWIEGRGIYGPAKVKSLTVKVETRSEVP